MLAQKPLFNSVQLIGCINMKELNFNGHKLSVIDENENDIWFVAKDVCKHLNIGDVSQACGQLDQDEKLVRVLDVSGQKRDTLTINESGLYTLVIRSNKPEAKKFRKWITSEVLPEIRKTGKYSVKLSKIEIMENYLAELKQNEQIKIERDKAIETKAEIGSRREATSMNTASQAVKQVNKLQIELDRSKEFCTVKRMTMLHHGQKFNWRLLKSTSNEMGVDAIEVFDANYGTVKSYHSSVWLEAYGLDIE